GRSRPDQRPTPQAPPLSLQDALPTSVVVDRPQIAVRDRLVLRHARAALVDAILPHYPDAHGARGEAGLARRDRRAHAAEQGALRSDANTTDLQSPDHVASRLLLGTTL